MNAWDNAWDEEGETYAVDAWNGPQLFVTDEGPPQAPERSPLALYWQVLAYLAVGGVLAWIGEALHQDLPTLCVLWLILGAWLWALNAMRGSEG